MANAPETMDTYLSGYERFRKESGFTPPEQEVVFLTISHENGCEYCMAAHSTIADTRSGVPRAATDAIRAGTPIDDPRLRALSDFSRAMLRKRGRPAQEDVDSFLKAGFREKQVLDIVLAIAVKTIRTIRITSSRRPSTRRSKAGSGGAVAPRTCNDILDRRSISGKEEAAERNGPERGSLRGENAMNAFQGKRAAIAGAIGTLAMTALLIAAPAMGLPPMNVGAMLGSVMGGSLVIGWMAHFVVGVVLALVYGLLFANRLPGPGFVRGAIYGIAPWLMAQVIVMPMMGAGLFSGSFVGAAGSLMGHLLYGAVLGAIYGAPRHAPCLACNAPARI
ncbi:MAG TPA: DUF6789 family protein [Myxococcales bacterium]